MEAEQDPEIADPLEYAQIARNYIRETTGPRNSNTMSDTQTSAQNNMLRMQALRRLVERLLRHQRTFRSGRQRSGRSDFQPGDCRRCSKGRSEALGTRYRRAHSTLSHLFRRGYRLRLIERVGTDASKLPLPVYEESKGVKGHLCLQVNPKFYRSAEQMLAHGIKLASLAPNITIKAPATQAGLDAIEGMTAAGARVNVTVSFSVAQAIAASQAIDRGLQRAKDPDSIHPYITIMIGRVDDQLKLPSRRERSMQMKHRSNGVASPCSKGQPRYSAIVATPESSWPPPIATKFTGPRSSARCPAIDSLQLVEAI